jgi:hypothetical protein
MACGAHAALMAQLNVLTLAMVPWSVQFTMSVDE